MIRAQHLVSCVRPLALAALLVGACGTVESSSPDASTNPVDAATNPVDASDNTADAANNTPDGGSFGITSSAYMDGGTIPNDNSCAGLNVSPALMWSNAPDNTQSFAIVFLDTSTNFLHSVIWDIPSSRTELPGNVEKVYEPSNVPGAKQPNSYLGSPGYAGPCPGSTHTYEFRLHALNVANLGGLSEKTSRGAVVAAIEAASIGSTTLTASFTP